MHKHIAQQWVAAVRSGRYEMGANCLRRGDTYSFFGVLCDISNLHGWQLDLTNKNYDHYMYAKATIGPPKIVRLWAGMNRYKYRPRKDKGERNACDEIYQLESAYSPRVVCNQITNIWEQL